MHFLATKVAMLVTYSVDLFTRATAIISLIDRVSRYQFIISLGTRQPSLIHGLAFWDPHFLLFSFDSYVWVQWHMWESHIHLRASPSFTMS
jgi:hypothetical protein